MSSAELVDFMGMCCSCSEGDENYGPHTLSIAHSTVLQQSKSWGDALLFAGELSSFPQFLWANSAVAVEDFLKSLEYSYLVGFSTVW